MEYHRKLYKSSTKELSRHMESAKGTERPPKTGQDSKNEVEKITHEAANGRPISNMANARSTQGTKRHLSLSPLKNISEEKIMETDPNDPHIEMAIHLSKKRLVASQEMMKTKVAGNETGNDLSRGHTSNGNTEAKKLSRTESKMAAPMVKTNKRRLQIDHTHITSDTEALHIETCLLDRRENVLNLSQTGSIIIEDYEDISAPNSQNDVMTDQPHPSSKIVEEVITAPSHSSTTTKTPSCPSNTTIGEAPSIICPSNTTVGEAPSIICPSNTTVGEAPSMAPSEEAPSMAPSEICPSNTTVGEALSMAPSTTRPSNTTVGEALSTTTEMTLSWPSNTTLLCPSNTTVGEALFVTAENTLPCPSNMTVADAPFSRCPSNTTVGEALSISSIKGPPNKTGGETLSISSISCPSNSTVGVAPSIGSTPITLVGECSPNVCPCPPSTTTLPRPSSTTAGEANIATTTTVGPPAMTVRENFSGYPHTSTTPLNSSNHPPATSNRKNSACPPLSAAIEVNSPSTVGRDTPLKSTNEPAPSTPLDPPTPKVDPKKNRLRPRQKPTTLNSTSPPCSNCSVCKDPTNNTVSKKPPQHPPRGRGRPRKNQSSKAANTSQEIQNSQSKSQSKSQPDKSQDLFGVLTEIKNELGEVKDKQETCHDDLCKMMDTRMSDFKQSLGIEINTVKENVEENTTELTHVQAKLDVQKASLIGIKTDVDQSKLDLSDLKNSQNTVKDKVEDLDGKIAELRQLADGMELEVIRQKKNHNKLGLSMSTQVSEIEHELVHHIEIIKSSMEEEVSEAKHNQKLIENKLANFSDEISHQNSNLNIKIQDLQKDFEQLKTLNERVNTSSGSNSRSSCHLPSDSDSNSSANIPFYPQRNANSSNIDTQGRYNSCDPTLPQDENSFYMYGDTTKSLILDGVREKQNESLRDIAWECIIDIGIPITQADIENVFRIGKPDKNRSRPRPIKLVLRDQTVRDQIFLFNARLRFSQIFKDVRINKEEPKDLRIKIAKLRQAGQAAQKLGHRVQTRPGGIIIDGKGYSASNLRDIPQKFMEEANKVKTPPPPQNTCRLSLSQRCRTTSSETIMVGPALQKTPRGLAFYSHLSFLSNFHKCKICFRNQTFSCLEQGYQCTKAELSDDWEAYDNILKMTLPADQKRAGARIVTTAFWEAHKLEVMEDLLFCKFSQNKQLYYSLLNTRPLGLIEATTDDFWGAGCIFGSIALVEGSWEGRNNLGKLLMKVRNFFVKELENGQGSIQ